MEYNQRCNLRCRHFYLDSDALTKKDLNELTTEEGKRLIDQLAEVSPATMTDRHRRRASCIREDIFDLSSHASKKA